MCRALFVPFLAGALVLLGALSAPPAAPAQDNSIDHYRAAIAQLDYNAYRDDAKAIEAMVKAGRTDGSPLVARWAQLAGASFGELAAGARSPIAAYPPIAWKGPGRFPPMSQAALWKENLIPLVEVHALARLMCLYALSQLEAGAEGDALMAYECAFSFASRLAAEDGLVITKIASLNAYRMTMEAVRAAMAAGFATPAFDSRIYAIIAANPVERCPTATAYRAEQRCGALSIGAAYEMLSNPPAEMLAAASEADRAKYEQMRAIMPGSVDEMLALDNQLWDEIVAANQAPWAQYVAFDPRAAAERIHPLLLVSLGNFLNLRAREEQVIAQARMLQLEAAIRWHHATTGAPPTDLAELQLPGPMPLDPFVQQPFHYLPGASEVLLYSVGPNMRDEGGQAEWQEQAGNEGPGDIVVRFRL
jgi:hypothetical protein